RIKVGGHYVRSSAELIAASFGPDADKAKAILNPIWNRVPTRFIPGGQSQMVFRLPKTPENADYWERFDKDQARWELEFCYCSVLNECWQVIGKWQEPARVKKCVRDEATEFTP